MATIPLRFDFLTCPMPVVQARVEGRIYPFALDTGSYYDLLLRPWFVQSLGRGFSSLSFIKDKMMVSSFKLRDFALLSDNGQFIPLKMKGSVVDEREALPYDEVFSGERIAGVIGLPLIRGFEFELSLRRGVLNLLPSDSSAELSRLFVNVNIGTTNKRAIQKCFVDTGAQLVTAQVRV